MKKRTIVWLVIAVVVIGVLTWILSRSGQKELVMSTARVVPVEVEITVMATGYVQPVDKVEVGTQVSGVIEKIYVDFNSQVKKGQLLAELDKLTLNEKLSQSNASLLSSQSDLTYAQQNYNRVQQLYDVNAATQVSYEEAVNRLTQAETALTNARANVQQAQVNLSYANITSPIDGIVLERAVEEGQTVASSFNTPTLFTIANDLTKMQVEADVDEADIGRVELGQRVVFSVDAYNDIEFEGTVNQIRLQPTVTNNVVTYTVIIEAPNPDEKLFPGMTANITIITQSENGPTVPVEAFNFVMTPELAEKMNGTPAPPASPAAANGNSRNGRNGNGRTANASGSGPERTVWVREADGGATQRQITVGINDGVNAIVKSGLNEGEEVVLSASLEKRSAANKEATRNPLVPQGPRRR